MDYFTKSHRRRTESEPPLHAHFAWDFLIPGFTLIPFSREQREITEDYQRLCMCSLGDGDVEALPPSFC